MVVKVIRDFPPYTHDLRRLAEVANLKLSQSQKKILDKFSTFNIIGRYGDEKFDFYERYNKKGYAEKSLTITKNLLLWLKKEFLKK